MLDNFRDESIKHFAKLTQPERDAIRAKAEKYTQKHKKDRAALAAFFLMLDEADAAAAQIAAGADKEA